MLGLRFAARNIFRCSLQDLRSVLPPEHETMFSLREVMSYVAEQRRSALQLDSGAVMLQLVTVDELQLVETQARVFLPSRAQATALASSMFILIGQWMISGMLVLTPLQVV